MARGIHPLMQYADDINSVFVRDEEDEMASGRILPIAGANIVTVTPSLWISGEPLKRLIDVEQVRLRLPRIPTITREIPDG